jgi:hypothetical protein
MKSFLRYIWNLVNTFLKLYSFIGLILLLIHTSRTLNVQNTNCYRYFFQILFSNNSSTVYCLLTQYESTPAFTSGYWFQTLALCPQYASDSDPGCSTDDSCAPFCPQATVFFFYFFSLNDRHPCTVVRPHVLLHSLACSLALLAFGANAKSI